MGQLRSAATAIPAGGTFLELEGTATLLPIYAAAAEETAHAMAAAVMVVRAVAAAGATKAETGAAGAP